MAYPNPEIYGLPETWHDCYYGGGSTASWAALLHGEKAKVPTWDTAHPTDTPTFENSQLRYAVDDNKLTPTQPIDNSLCAVGQGTASPFRQFTIFRCDETTEHPNGEILQVGHAFTGANYNDNNLVNTFWFESNSFTTSGIYGNGAFSRGRLQIRDGATVTQGIDQRIWSPTGVNAHSTNRQNGNFYIAPFLSYGTRSYVLQIWVWVTNADYDAEFVPSTGTPAGEWKTLDSWKNNYSNKAITACLLTPRSISTYNSSTGIIGYSRVSYESQQYRKVASGILDEIKFEFDDGTSLPDLTAYGLFSANSNANVGVALFNEMTLYKWSDTLQNIGIVNSHIASYIRSNGSFMTPYIPYSDDIYEWIMSATACFGMAFTPAKDKGIDASNCVFNQDFLDADLCLPIISDVDGAGALQGNYTRGTNNVNNDFINLESIFDWQPTHHDIVHDNPDGTEYFNQFSNAYNNALSNLNNNYRIRLEILTDEETVIGEITKDLSLTAAGQITINYEQITRRSCSLSLINVDNKYIPTKNSPFWLNRKFKLWLGLVVGKDTYWWSQGIFYTVSANATGRILSIEGVDKGGALDGTLKLNMTEAQYQFKRGKALTEMIKQTLALDVGNPYGSKNFPIGFGGNRPIDSQPPLIGIEYYGFNTVADISIDANSYISEMFVNMAELYAADCYYNTNGNLVFEQHIDSSGYNYVPTQWSFTDLSSTFEDVNYEYSYEGENVVTVYTNTTEAGVRNVAWTAYNTNPLSPLNVATGIRRAPHIEIPYYHNKQLSQDQQEAQQIKDCRSTANHYLLANSMLGMTLNFNAPIIPHMDVNKTIQISDQYADIENGIYVVQSITIPLSSDKMQISATNINWLPNDMTFSGVSEIVQSNNNQNGGAET